MVQKEEAKAIVKQLVGKFNHIVSSGKVSEYHEERTKSEFIEPLFQALGWDMQCREREDEVIKEERISKGRVDYAFRINGMLKFFLEAKGMKSATDEGKSAEQAINYAYHKKVAWAIVCDFETLKVYNSGWIGDRLDQKRFVSLDASNYEAQFEKLWWLSRESFENGVLDREAQILGKMKKSIAIDELLLNDFMVWRKKLSTDIMSHANKDMVNIEKIDGIVQNILDRFIFIRTCEDRGIEEKVLWQALLNSKSSKKSLLEHVREVFRNFDQNYDSRLFTLSESDSVRIDNLTLKEIIEGLYGKNRGWVDYNFALIDADILGNIYEQYLGHILSKTPKKAKLTENGTHRKEQGIYYTPTYIVDYIVKNTLGEMLKTKNLADLPQIKVLDPACGSGSFLIRAFETLNQEYQKKSGFDTVFKKNQILKDNIFGVDLDPQATEIAQLNLLLRAAEKRIKLPMLQGNIKCGNSLIDDPAVAGDRAFKWEEKFSDIMKGGGFDVVIGNPPYVRQEELSEIKPYLQEKYETFHGMADIFVYFFEREMELLKDGGYFGMIVSNKWLRAGYGVSLRKFVSKFWVERFIDFGDLKVFPDATIYPCIIIMRKMSKQNPKMKVCKMDTLNFGSLETYINEKSFTVDQRELGEKEWNIQNEDANGIINKIEASGEKLEKFVGSKICYGIKTGFNEAFVINEETKKRLVAEDKKSSEIIKPFLVGSEIKRYHVKSKRNSIILTKIGVDIDKYPSIKRRLTSFQKELEKRWDKGDHWYELRACAYYDSFAKPKIIWGNLATKSSFMFDDNGFYVNAPACILPTDSKYVLGILNSKLMSYFLKSICAERQGGFIEQKPVYVSRVPIKKPTTSENDRITKLVEKIIAINKQLLDNTGRDKLELEEDLKSADNEIDGLVYKIYGITKEEQKIIEESLK